MTPSSSLLQWLSTFKLDNNKSAVELDNDAYYNLADGYVCARILNQISPIYFTDQWLNGIKPVPPNGSWRLRVSNLKRILQKIYDYASDLQSHQFKPSAISPDVTVIAQNFDPDQINRLIQLILFCAINCDKKQAYIEMIRDLPTQIKQDIKEAIEELLVKNVSNDQALNSANNNVGDNLNNSTLSNNTIGDTSTTNRQFNTSSSSSASASNVNIINSSPARHIISTNFTNNLDNLRNRRDSAQSDTNRGQQQQQQSDISATSYHSETNTNKSYNLTISANETIESLKQKLQAALAVNDSKAQACHELEMKLKQLKVERDQIAYENEQLISCNEKIKSNETHRRQSSSNINELKELSSANRRDNESSSQCSASDELARQQNKRLQNEVQRLKEEIIRIETEKEDYRLKSNLLKEDLDRITMRHENLRDKAEQARRLQDELDEHKHISGKVISYEQMIENLVKKNNEMKKELKSLEEKNLSHVQNIVRLEQENQQLAASVNQVEIYRKQLNEAHSKLSEETHRADKAEVELSRLSDKLESTRRENEKLFEATNQLMLTSSASKDRQQQQQHSAHKQNNIVVDTLGQRMFESVDLKETTTSGASTAAAATKDNDNDQQDNMISSISTTVIELKEKIARLEMENQLLEARLNLRPENNKTVLGGLLEESTEKCKRLENENRQARKKIMLLESNLKDLMSSHQNNQAQTSSSSTSSKQQQGFVLQQQDTSSDNVLALIKRVEDLQRSLYNKDQELREVETKYKRNIQKAREVMKALNSNGGSTGTAAAALGPGVGLHPSFMSSASSFNSNSLDETNLLRQQLRDREDRLIELEREFYEFKKLKEVHERLILSAFYGLTTPMQWKNAEKRLERTTLTSPPNTANSSMNNNFSPGGKHSH